MSLILRYLIAGLIFFVFSAQASANSKYASLVIDADSGIVLHDENGGKKRYPASLTKMMTLYLTFQAIERKKLSLNQRIKVSSRAAAQPPSKLGLRRGQYIKVKDAIQALVVKSANDVAVVLAEAIAGSEWQFAMMMTSMAKRLGMNHTRFKNASGLHHKRQTTTAYDMARLAVALRRDFSKYYYYFNKTKFFYKGRLYRGHNRVVQKYRGADGLKTGYIRASGFNLVTSAKRNGRRVVAVVMGGRTAKSRDRHMISLLNKSFVQMAKGKTGKERLFTGVIPTPVLRPDNLIAKVGVMPKFSPETKISLKEKDDQPKVSKNIPVPVLKPQLLASMTNAGSELIGVSAGEQEEPVAKKTAKKVVINAKNPFPRFKPAFN